MIIDYQEYAASAEYLHLLSLAVWRELRPRLAKAPAGAAEVPLPDRLAGAVGLHMIGHVRPDDRRALWSALAQRLAPGAPVIVNVQPPDTAVEVPLFPPFGWSVGRLSYQGQGRAEPTGPESIRWQMTYRTLDGDRVLTEATAEYHWWVVSAATLSEELTAAGLTVAPAHDDLVVAHQPSPHLDGATDVGSRD